MRYSELLTEKPRYPKDKTDKYKEKGIKGMEFTMVDNTLTRLNAYIDKNCQPWLNEIGTLNRHSLVWRGLSEPKKVYFTKAVRPDRLPTDTKYEIHDLFQSWIKQAGKKAHRSNSIFVTGDIDEAAEYGVQTYTVFPMGRFNYTWHPLYNDWTRNIQDDIGLYSDDQDGYDEPYGILKDPKFQKKLIKGLKGDDGTLRRAIKSGNEIMLRANKAIYISSHFMPELFRNRNGKKINVGDWTESMMNAFLTGDVNVIDRWDHQ